MNDVRGAGPGRKLRIVHVLDNLKTGGTELNAVRTAERLDRTRFDVQFLCLQPDGPLRVRLDAAGIPVRGMPIQSLMSLSAVRRGMEIRSIVGGEGIDIVHAHDPYANVLAAPWVRLARRGAVIASHRWWRNVHPPRVRAANRIAYRFAHRVLANSESVGEYVVREEGVPRHKLVVIPNFVDEAAFAPLSESQLAALRSRVGLSPGEVAIGMVANLYPVKNHVMLLRSAARLSTDWPRVKFVLIGEGQEREALERLVRELGLGDRVLMPGQLAHQSGLGQLFEIAVLTSSEEGFPNWVVEAMAAGRPVVATAVGAVPDAVVEGETGYLVAPDDDAQMSRALDTLLRNPGRAAIMGAAGTARAQVRYHVRSVLHTLESLYVKLAEESHR